MMIGKTVLLVCALVLVTVTVGYEYDDPSQAPSICATPGSDDTLVAHEYCNKFYTCYRGVPVTIDCPAGLLYNYDRQYCDWCHIVDCGNRIVDNDGEVNNYIVNDVSNNDASNNDNNDGNSDASEAERICAGENSDGVLVAHENCNQFYKCSEGIPVALDCPPGLVYNPVREYCHWPSNVECGDRVTS